jgi:triphosphoribosyl-dephospho-CoA synthase
MTQANRIRPERVRDAYLAACRLDVEAIKPGNVSERAPGHGMSADDFHQSAVASVSAVCDPRLPLGERIYRAVAATRERVGCNTNLGIVLLCAPLAQAAMKAGPGEHLHPTLLRVLDQTTVADAQQVYAAIRLAKPAGLGAAAEHDVQDEACVTLREAMAAAADRDLIAAQYANGYADLFGDALPRLAAGRGWRGGDCAAVTDLYLHLLSRFSDSHIGRKLGGALADAVREAAIGCHAGWRAAHPAEGDERLLEFDRNLKRRGINPGTTADLTVATLFLERLLRAATPYPGTSRRTTLRQSSLTYGRAPLISMLLTGESRKWQ